MTAFNRGITFRANRECRVSTHLSRSLRVSRTAGVGHEYALDRPRVNGSIAPKPAVRRTSGTKGGPLMAVIRRRYADRLPAWRRTATQCRSLSPPGTATGLPTSTGGVLTGRGADIIVIDDPLKPEEALSEAQRQAANEWYDHTLYSRLNDKRSGAIVIVMQRLHEDDVVGHVLAQETWEVVRFPAIAEADEVHEVETIWGAQ